MRLQRRSDVTQSLHDFIVDVVCDVLARVSDRARDRARLARTVADDANAVDAQQGGAAVLVVIVFLRNRPGRRLNLFRKRRVVFDDRLKDHSQEGLGHSFREFQRCVPHESVSDDNVRSAIEQIAGRIRELLETA